MRLIHLRLMKNKRASCSSNGRQTFNSEILNQPATFRSEAIVYELLHLKVLTTESYLSFVTETGIDALAVSVGNVHGFYEGEPELDFDLIKELKQRTGIPLVLHGGSGISDDDFRHAVKNGIRKINFFTEMSKLATDCIRELLKSSDDYFIQDLLKESKEKIKEVVKGRVLVFGSAKACTLPGNICPKGGSHTPGTVCNICDEPVAAPQKDTLKASIQDADIVDIVTKAVSDILKKYDRA